MTSYFIRRVLLVIPTLVLVTFIVFVTIRLVPGSVVDMMASNLQITDQAGRDAIAHELGLDVPLGSQYLRWVGLAKGNDGKVSGLLQGNLGNSLWTQTPVARDFAARWPVTLELTIVGLITSLLIALPIGIYSAIRQDTVGDYIARSAGILLIAVPTFWIGTMIIVTPFFWHFYRPPIRYIAFGTDPLTNIRLILVPGIIIGMGMSGTVVRMMRTTMLDVLRQDYIRTAWAKGLSEWLIIFRHALKNALIPVVTIVGLQASLLIGEAVIVEKIFNLPGLGSLLVDAASERDYPIVSAVLLLVALIVVAVNMLVDLSYHLLDPRIQHD